jgi:hypothetical protein
MWVALDADGPPGVSSSLTVSRPHASRLIWQHERCHIASGTAHFLRCELPVVSHYAISNLGLKCVPWIGRVSRADLATLGNWQRFIQHPAPRGATVVAVHLLNAIQEIRLLRCELFVG